MTETAKNRTGIAAGVAGAVILAAGGFAVGRAGDSSNPNTGTVRDFHVTVDVQKSAIICPAPPGWMWGCNDK